MCMRSDTGTISHFNVKSKYATETQAWEIRVTKNAKWNKGLSVLLMQFSHGALKSDTYCKYIYVDQQNKRSESERNPVDRRPSLVPSC